ncbi:hypothetical protein VINI7043_27850 [Vibrio nigripulchritudo ATCC 27043]|nr:hypothetical protein VINI7043_27850 [Vibrio nigripulchritudo ATCC 27043]
MATQKALSVDRAFVLAIEPSVDKLRHTLIPLKRQSVELCAMSDWQCMPVPIFQTLSIKRTYELVGTTLTAV